MHKPHRCCCHCSWGRCCALQCMLVSTKFSKWFQYISCEWHIEKQKQTQEEHLFTRISLHPKKMRMDIQSNSWNIRLVHRGSPRHCKPIHRHWEPAYAKHVCIHARMIGFCLVHHNSTFSTVMHVSTFLACKIMHKPHRCCWRCSWGRCWALQCMLLSCWKLLLCFILDVPKFNKNFQTGNWNLFIDPVEFYRVKNPVRLSYVHMLTHVVNVCFMLCMCVHKKSIEQVYNIGMQLSWQCVPLMMSRRR